MNKYNTVTPLEGVCVCVLQVMYIDTNNKKQQKATKSNKKQQKATKSNKKQQKATKSNKNSNNNNNFRFKSCLLWLGLERPRGLRVL
jgi:hypothetical protein